MWRKKSWRLELEGRKTMVWWTWNFGTLAVYLDDENYGAPGLEFYDNDPVTLDNQNTGPGLLEL